MVSAGSGHVGEEHRFPFRFAAAYRVPALFVGVTPATAEVKVTVADPAGLAATLDASR